MKYEVTIHANISFNMEIDANNEQDAVSKVKDEFMLSSVSECELNSKPLVVTEEMD